MTPEDLIRIRHAAQSTLENSKLVLERGGMADLEVSRDSCIEVGNAVQVIIDGYENEKDACKKEKRRLDDRIADLNREQREFSAYKSDLQQLSKRANNQFWDEKKGRAIHDPEKRSGIPPSL